MPNAAHRNTRSTGNFSKAVNPLGKRKPAPQANWPIPVEVTLYYVDERARPTTLRKNTRYTRKGSTPVSCNRGTVFSPGTASYESRNHAAVLAWIKARKAEGFITLSDLQELQQFRVILARSRSAGAKYDPASIANKSSGKGLKGSRRPTRDYKGSATVAMKGYAPVRVSVVDRG